MKLLSLLIAACLITSCEQKNKTNPNKDNAASNSQPAAAKQGCCSNCKKTAKKKDSCPKCKKATAAGKEDTCPNCKETAPKADTASDESIYQITSPWTDDTGKQCQLSSLKGTVQVITMGYSTCKYACPKLLADMLTIQDSLSPETRAKTHFAFFSIDPDTDTPTRLQAYRKEHNLDPKQWSLFTAPTPTVQELAVVLGLKYRKVGKSSFAHSNLIIVLNKKGEVVHSQEGLSADPKPTINAIEKLNNSK